MAHSEALRSLMADQLAGLRSREGDEWDEEYRPLTPEEDVPLGELMAKICACLPKEAPEGVSGRFVVSAHWAHSPTRIVCGRDLK